MKPFEELGTTQQFISESEAVIWPVHGCDSNSQCWTIDLNHFCPCHLWDREMYTAFGTHKSPNYKNNTLK